jgi:hypothetical protein
METRQEKAARMAAALRANLRKRKEQSREQAGTGDTAPPAPPRKDDLL